jgi:hypothetical protein
MPQSKDGKQHSLNHHQVSPLDLIAADGFALLFEHLLPKKTDMRQNIPRRYLSARESVPA